MRKVNKVDTFMLYEIYYDVTATMLGRISTAKIKAKKENDTERLEKLEILRKQVSKDRYLGKVTYQEIQDVIDKYAPMIRDGF